MKTPKQEMEEIVALHEMKVTAQFDAEAAHYRLSERDPWGKVFDGMNWRPDVKYGKAERIPSVNLSALPTK